MKVREQQTAVFEIIYVTIYVTTPTTFKKKKIDLLVKLGNMIKTDIQTNKI